MSILWWSPLALQPHHLSQLRSTSAHTHILHVLGSVNRFGSKKKRQVINSYRLFGRRLLNWNKIVIIYSSHIRLVHWEKYVARCGCQWGVCWHINSQISGEKKKKNPVYDLPMTFASKAINNIHVPFGLALVARRNNGCSSSSSSSSRGIAFHVDVRHGWWAMDDDGEWVQRWSDAFDRWPIVPTKSNSEENLSKCYIELKTG